MEEGAADAVFLAPQHDIHTRLLLDLIPGRHAKGSRLMSRPVPDIAIRAEALAELAGTDFEAAVAERDAESASTERDLLDLALTVGILRSFAGQATSYVTTKSRPWPGSGYDRAADDPHVLRGFGRFLSAVRAAEELFVEAVSSVADNRPDAAERIAVAQAFALDAGAPGISDTIGLSAPARPARSTASTACGAIPPRRARSRQRHCHHSAAASWRRTCQTLNGGSHDRAPVAHQCQCPVRRRPSGAWRAPEGNPRAPIDIAHFQNIARIAERGLLDTVFLADALAVQADVKTSPMWALDPR